MSIVEKVATYVAAYEASVGEKPSAVRLCDNCVETHIAELIWSRVGLRLLGRPVLRETFCGKVVCYACDTYTGVC